MQTKPQRNRIEVARHLALPVIFLGMLSVPWFLGGRDPFGSLVIVFLTAFLLASWLLMSRFQALAVSWRPRLVMIPLALLLGWAALSSFWSVSRFESTTLLITLGVAGLVFCIARDVFRDQPARDFYVRIFLIIAAVMAAIGIGMYVIGDYDRATSLFYWPNPFATFLIASLSLALLLGHSEDGQLKPDMWSLMSALLGAALVLTYSRGGWLVMLIVLGLMLWRSRHRLNYLKHLGVVVAISIILVLAASAARGLLNKPRLDVAGRVTESTQSSSVFDRLDFWRAGTVMFADKPIGWGVGTFKEVYPAYQRSATKATNNPHSSMVQVFVELGAVGAALMIVAIFGFLQLVWRWRRDNLPVAVWGGQLAVIGIGMHSMLELVTNYPVLIVLLAIMLALALPLREDTSEFRLRHWPAIVTFVVVIMAVVAALRFQQFRYLSSMDRKLIDVYAPLEPERAADMYRDLLQRPVVEPDAFSAAAIFFVDQYDRATTPEKADLDTALGYAKRAVELEPRDARHYYALANVQQRLGKVSEALENYRRAVELDPHNNPQYQVSLALLLQQQGFTRQALSVLRPIANEYTEAVLANRNFASNIRARIAIVYTLLARLENESKNIEQARRDIARALELNPRYVPAQDLQKQLQSSQ